MPLLQLPLSNLYVMLQMLGLQVNSFVDVCDYDEAKSHMVIASKMDI